MSTPLRGRPAHTLAAAFVAGVCAWHGPGEAISRAQPALPANDPNAGIEEAKRLFKAGARAYEAGKYRAAWQAFDQAYELTPRPELRYSAAQALRRLYTVDAQREYLERALVYYRQYLAAVPQGGRRLDATTAAEEIEKLLGPSVTPPEPTTAAPQRPSLATLIVDSPTGGARVALGKDEPGEAPLVRDLPAGRYTIRVSADGFIPVEREVDTIAGRVKSLDIELKEQPGELAFDASDGVDLVIDGKPVGQTPLGAPVDVPSGRHRLVAGKTGYEVFVDDLVLGRGERRTVAVDLAMTPQRVAAWAVVGLGLAGAGAGAGLSVVAFYEQSKAIDIEELQEARPLTVEERDAHNGAIDRRDDFRRWATVAAGFAAAAAATGLALFLADEPKLYAVAKPPKDDGTPERGAPAARDGKREPRGSGATLGIAPFVAPEVAPGIDRANGVLAGVTAVGRFE